MRRTRGREGGPTKPKQNPWTANGSEGKQLSLFLLLCKVHWEPGLPDFVGEVFDSRVQVGLTRVQLQL